MIFLVTLQRSQISYITWKIAIEKSCCSGGGLMEGVNKDQLPTQDVVELSFWIQTLKEVVDILVQKLT